MSRRLTRQEQIERMTEKHNGYYSYDHWGHPVNKEKSTITCPEHGDFEQNYRHHVKGQGCPECGNQRISRSASKRYQDPEFREKMAKKWQDPEFREMMSKSASEQWENPEFREMMSKVSSETMSKQWQDPEFREMMSKKSKDLWQDPEFQEMMANINRDGPSKGEAETIRVLTEYGYKEIKDEEKGKEKDYVREKGIPGTGYRFDFYLIAENLIVEIHGLQHYIGWAGKEENLKKKQYNDKVKKDWALEKGYNYLAIPCRNDKDLRKIENVLLNHIIDY